MATSPPPLLPPPSPSNYRHHDQITTIIAILTCPCILGIFELLLQPIVLLALLGAPLAHLILLLGTMIIRIMAKHFLRRGRKLVTIDNRQSQKRCSVFKPWAPYQPRCLFSPGWSPTPLAAPRIWEQASWRWHWLRLWSPVGCWLCLWLLVFTSQRSLPWGELFAQGLQPGKEVRIVALKHCQHFSVIIIFALLVCVIRDLFHFHPIRTFVNI